MKAAILLALAAALSIATATPAAASFPTEDRVPAPGLNCLERVDLPALDNVIDAKWSPDGAMLAVNRLERRPSATNPSGYVEDEVVDLVDMRTKRVRSLGTIEYGRPTWSPTGKYLAYWGWKADFLEVMDRARGEVIAKLTPSMPDFQWVGDRLVFVQGSTIREWTAGRPLGTLGKIVDKHVPHYPRSDWTWSGDGSRFLLTKYDPEDPQAEWWVGATETADVLPLDLPGATYAEWAPGGSILLVRYAAAIEIRDFSANAVSTVRIARNAMHQWGPDGKTLFIRAPRPSVVAGDTFEQLTSVWPVEGRTTIIPNVFGIRAFSPDSRWFGGTVRTDRHDTRFEAFRCYEIVRGDAKAEAVPVAPRFEKLDGGTARLIRPVAGGISQFVHVGHSGVDVAAPFGSPIVAADAGTVTGAGWHATGEGGYAVCLQHGGGLETCYYHLSTFLVGVGERVARGQPIAIVGMSGRTRGPHVHWEAKLNGRIIDPLLR